MAGPLEGIRVIECGVWVAAPLAASLLGDLGAEVIKVEPPQGGDPARGFIRERGVSFELSGGRTILFEIHNRSKKSIAVDLTKAKGREIVHRLVKDADIFIHNFRLDAAERMGIDERTLRNVNPNLIYAVVSGFGLKGPHSTHPALDYLGLARSGVRSMIGEPDDPLLRRASLLSDYVAALTFVIGMTTALIARERKGIAQMVDTSLLGSMLFGPMNWYISYALLTGREYPPVPRDFRKWAPNPLYNYYRCGDGKWIALALVQTDRFWHAFCEATGLQHIEKDPKFATEQAREQNCRELISILDETFAKKPREEWLRALGARDLLCAPVNSALEVPEDPQVMENEYIADMDHPTMGRIKVTGIPIKFQATPGEIKSPPPELGQHTEEVLLDLGYTWEDIAALKEEGIIL